MKKIDIEKVMKGFTGELNITAKCNDSDVEQKIEYKNGNKICLLFITFNILSSMYQEGALDKRLLETLISMLKDLIEEE